jgi:L-malate glycosyltransferase
MKKKVALVYDAIYPYIKGGGEKRFFEIGKRLSKRNCEVHFYGMNLWGGKKVIEKDGMYYHGICENLPLYTEDKRRSISQSLSFGISSFKLIKEDFDVIDCCGFPYFSLFPAKLACLIKGKPLNATWHEVWGKEYWRKYLGWKGIFGYWIEKLASKLPNKIIAVSEDTKRKLIKTLRVSKKKIIVIPNGINHNEIQSIKPSKEKSDIIYAGRLLSHKNINVLIQAVKELTKSNPQIKCIIVGDGPERESLEKLTKQLKLEKNISFKGFIEKLEDVYALIKSSKIFVLPSTREGFGIILIDANACGIPVITTNHKDNASKDLIKEGKNGFICKLDEEEIKKKIKKGLKGYKKMKKGCISSAEKFNWDNLIKKFEEVYAG